MEVQVQETGPCRRTLTIKIPSERVRKHVDEMYASASQQVKIKGFRPGKVPRKVLEKRFGEALLNEAKSSLISRSFEDACREKELAMVGRPQIDEVAAGALDTGKDFEFTIHLDVRPEIVLDRVKGIEVQGPDTAVTDEDLDKALDQIADQRRSLEPVDDGIAEGDFAKADLLYRNEAGEQVHRRENVQVNARIPVAGTDPEQFAKKLEGTDPGDTVEIRVTFPDSFEKEEVRGQVGTLALTVKQVLRVTPAPIDDALAKAFEFDDLDALKADMRVRIEEEKVRVENNRVEEEILQRLLGENPFEIPSSVVEEQKEHSLHQFRHRLEEEGMAEEEIKKKIQEAGAEALEEAERKVRVFFLLDAIAAQEQIQVADRDLTAEMHRIAQANSAPLEEVQSYFAEDNRMGDLRIVVIERKVREFLRENASITDN